MLTQLRARCMLAVAAQPGAPRSSLAAAEQCIRTLAKSDIVSAMGYRAALEAQVEYLRGRAEGAVRWLREALPHFEQAEMRLELAAALLNLAELSGSEGERLSQRARESLNAEGVLEPARLVRFLMPGFIRGRR